MPVAKLTLELEVPHAQSLKDRRQVVRSLKDSLRHGFNVSIAEMDEGLVWNRATLEVVAISPSVSYLTGQLRAVEQSATRHATRLGALLTDAFAEVLTESTEGDLDLADEASGDDDGVVGGRSFP